MVSGSGTRLWTWTEVLQHLRATYGGTTERGGGVEVVVPARAASGGGDRAGSQALDVGLVDVAGAAWLKIAGVIGSLRNLSQLEMLANNARATIGVFCTRDGLLALRHTLPLAGLQAGDLDETLREVADLVAWSRQRTRELGGP
jgi:hypothetical protein